jgi:hypothetical protein
VRLVLGERTGVERVDVFEAEVLAVGDAIGLAELARLLEELLELHWRHYTPRPVRALWMGGSRSKLAGL